MYIPEFLTCDPKPVPDDKIDGRSWKGLAEKKNIKKI